MSNPMLYLCTLFEKNYVGRNYMVKNRTRYRNLLKRVIASALCLAITATTIFPVM